MAFFPIHVVATALVVVVCTTAIVVRLFELDESHQGIALATGFTVLGLIAYARYFLRLPWMGASVVYLILFWLFHFGMTFTAAFVPSVLDHMPDDSLDWFYAPGLRLSMILAVLGAAGFVFGVGVFGRHPVETPDGNASGEYDAGLYVGGWLVMVSSMAIAIVVFVQNGGSAIFSMRYLEFRALLLGPTRLPTALEFAQLGCLLALCGARGGRWRRPVVAWSLVLAAPMLIIGSRATALLPLVVFAVVLARRGVRFRRSAIAATALACSIVIPAVSSYRAVGFANRDLVEWTDVTPLDTVVELGGTLQSTRAYVDWIERGDPYLLGSSYWAPFDRQVLVRVIPGREPIDYQDDERVPLRLMDEREGAIGGSSTGEAYYNFGAAGPFIYFAAVGLLVGWLERRAASTPYNTAILGVALLAMYFNIRTDWLSIPASVAQGVAVVAGCYVLRRIALDPVAVGGMRLSDPAATAGSGAAAVR